MLVTDNGDAAYSGIQGQLVVFYCSYILALIKCSLASICNSLRSQWAKMRRLSWGNCDELLQIIPFKLIMSMDQYLIV